MSNKIWLRSIVSFAFIITLASCGGNKNKMAGPGGAGGPPEGPMPYKTAPVYYGAATVQYSFPATIQGEQNVEIRLKVDGFIEKIYVDEGAIVHKIKCCGLHVLTILL